MTEQEIEKLVQDKLNEAYQSYKAISVSVSSWQKLNRNLQKRQAQQPA